MAFGSKSKLLYSTAHIMTAFRVDATDVLVIYGDVGQTVELAVAVGSFATVEVQGLSITSRIIKVCFLLSLLVSISGSYSQGQAIINLKITHGIHTAQLTDVDVISKVLIVDYVTATTFWQPVIDGQRTFANYIDIAGTTPILVAGPYLVRNATLDGQTLSVNGDLNMTTTLQVFGPGSINHVRWNGQDLKLSKTAWGSLSATLPGPERDTVSLPSLKDLTWKYADSLPEVHGGYDDSKWINADHTTTTSKFPRYYGGPWNLSIASDYGYNVCHTSYLITN